MPLDLFSRNKAEKSQSKVEKREEDVPVISLKISSSGPDNMSSLISPGAISPAQSVSAAMYQGIPDSDILQPALSNRTQDDTLTKTKSAIPMPVEVVVHIPQKTFDQNITPPVVKYALPEVRGRITSTPQLAYCLSLLHPSSVLKEDLDEIEVNWLRTIFSDPDEQEQLRTMSTDLVKAFIRCDLKKPNVVAEIAAIAPVLDQDDFRKLLQTFVDGIDQTVLLNIHLLDGLAHLIRNAVQGCIDSDDLVEILKLLNTRLKDTHKQSTRHTHRLAVTISHLLDSMVDSQVEGLSREQLHEPLSDYFKELEGSSDLFYVYQAAYAYQALQHIPDDETILQTALRRTGKVVRGISGVVNSVKALDLDGFIEGLQSIQGSLAGARNAVLLATNAYSNVKTLAESGQGLLENLKESFNFSRKSAWYPALRGLDSLLQEGRFFEFEKLVWEAPCKHEPAFQLGVCQRLGELAANTVWGVNTRKCAVIFLEELYKDDAGWGLKSDIKQWLISIINQLVDLPNEIISNQARELLQVIGAESTAARQSIHLRGEKDHSGPYPTMLTLPPQESLLLNCVLNKPDVETSLHQLKRERLKDRGGDVYISPRAKASPRATEGFDLTSKLQEFLESGAKVFLVLGDSGVGKSTFNRAIEISLWDKYGKGERRIPIFIHLPSIERPDRDLVAERLRRANFTENQIRELKINHEFIVICDGYDECNQTQNLYMSNQFNQQGGWRAQMVISCRTEFAGDDYRGFFQPTDRNNLGVADQFQEAIIMPFNNNQIEDYVIQYVLLRKPQWESEDYRKAIAQIPNLHDLVKNPFLLKLALEVLPRLLQTNSKFTAACITRVGLYDEFIAQWIERGKIRLSEMELSPRDQEEFRELSDSGFKRHGISYLKELVTSIYENQGGNPVVSYSAHRDRKTWKEALFNKEDGKHLLREAIPLARDGDQYRFIHKSILEYGMSIAVFDPNENWEDAEPAPAISRRESTSSVLSFEIPVSAETTEVAIEQPLLDSPLGKRSFVGEQTILQFLSERAQLRQVFKDQLHSVVERSKIDKLVRIAAANAITILVQAGVQFNGVDLRGIQIPGADLSYGVFDSADLEEADLRKANMRNTWLRQANLRGAQMTGVQFGELPYLQELSPISCCMYSPDGTTFVVGLRGNNVSLYETSNWDIIRTLKGHTDSVTCIAYSPKGRWIASGSNDNTLRLWEIDSGDCVHTLQGHSNSITGIAYSPKGDQIASGSDDKTVRLWDVRTGDCAHTLQGHSQEIRSVAYSPKGDRIASGSDDETIRLWDVDTGDCVHTLQGHSGYVSVVLYSPKGDRIASGSDDATVRLWDIETGDHVHTLQGHSDTVTSVAYSPKGDRIASGSDDNTVRLWDVDTGDCVHTFQGHSGRVSVVVYSPKGDRIASGGYDRTVRLWDVDIGNCVHNLQGHNQRVSCIAYSPKGNQIASGSPDAKVQLYSIDNSDRVRVSQGHSRLVSGVVYSPKGNRIASKSGDLTVRLWNVDNGNYVQTLQGHDQEITHIVYSPKGDRVASGGWEKTLRLWDTNTGDCVHILQGHDEKITSVAYSPKGDQVASGSRDTTVRLWDVETGNCVHTLLGHSNYVAVVTYSPKGDKIASGSWDNTVRLWDVDTGNCAHTLLGHSKSVTSVVFSPKGDRIATGGEEETVRLWDVNAGDCVHIFQGHNHSSYIFGVAYSPKGDRVASGGHDMTVQLWNVDTGDCVHTLHGHSGAVFIVVYSPKGDRIASGSRDRTIRLWSDETGQCLNTIPVHGGVCSIYWKKIFDGYYYFVTGSNDTSVRQWQVIKEGDKYKTNLCWSSSHEVLTVAGASIRCARGLSRLNQVLLRQRGAMITVPRVVVVDST